MNTIGEVIKNLDSITTLINFLYLILSAGVVWAWRCYRNLKKIYKQLIPNGGSSVMDKINSILQSQKISEMRQQIVLSNLDLGYYECDISGACSYSNKKLCDLFGLSENEMHGNGWLKSVQDDERERVFDNWNRARMSLLPYDQNYHVINQVTKRRYYCRATVFTCFDDKKNPIYYFGTIQILKDLGNL